MLRDMSDTDKPRKPFVQAACICEHILIEKDGTVSAIRMVDRFVLAVPANLPPEIKPQASVKILIALKSDGHEGKYKLTLVVHGPTKTHPPQESEIEFNPVYGAGANLLVTFAFGVETFGECSIDVLWYGELLTKIPFTLVQAQASTEADR